MWNHDISAAPRDSDVWLATKCGKVIKSHWIEKFGPGRWVGLGTKEQPIAWQLFVTPEHPFQAKASDDNGATGQDFEDTADRVTGDASRPSRGGDTSAIILEDCGSGA